MTDTILNLFNGDATLGSVILSIISLICSCLISTTVSTIIKRSIDKKMDIHLNAQSELMNLKEETAQAARDAERDKILQDALAPIQEQLTKIVSTIDNDKEGTVTLLRESMKQTRDQFLKQGYVSASDWASWHELYNTYKKLGGNHFAEYVDSWKLDVDKLRAKSQLAAVQK